MAEIGHDGIPYNRQNYKPLIINVALTGAVPEKSEFPTLPITPKEIANDVERCFDLGAQVFHLHMRDSHGIPTQNLDLFQETIERIKTTTPDALLCVTTSSRVSNDREERFLPLNLPPHAHPDFASLSMGSFNFPGSVSTNPPDEIIQLAIEMKSKGIKPELEVFEPGMVSHALQLAKKGILDSPLLFNILLGNRGTSEASAQSLAPFLHQIPGDAEWGIAGIGRFQQKTTMLAIALGGNVRVGMEDDPKGPSNQEWSNLEAVSFAIDAAKLAGRSIESVDSVRVRLGISVEDSLLRDGRR